MKGVKGDLEKFLKEVDLIKEQVLAKIIDFGLAK